MKRAISATKELIVSATAKDTTIQFAGSFVSFFFGIVFTILAARLLGPEAFGIVVVAVAFVGIMNAVGDLGLGSSLFRYSSKFWQSGEIRKAQKIFGDIFVFRFLTAFALLVILVLLSPFLAPMVFKVSAPIIVVILAVDIFGFLLTDYQIQSFQAKRKFSHAAIITTLTNIIRVVLLLLFYLFSKVGLFEVILVYSVSPLLVFIISNVWSRVNFDFRSEWRKTLKNTKGFSFWMGSNRIINALSGRLDTMIILQLLGSYQTGIYGAARQLSFGVPIAIGSFATVLAPRYASFEGKNLEKFFRKSFLMSVLLSLAIIVGVFVAPFIISLFGTKYEQSLPVLQWLLVATIPYALFTPAVNMIIYTFGKPNFIFVLSLIQLPILLMMNVTLAPTYGVFAPVITIVFWNMSTLVISYSYLFILARRSNLKLI